MERRANDVEQRDSQGAEEIADAAAWCCPLLVLRLALCCPRHCCCSAPPQPKLDEHSVIKFPLTTESAMKKIEDNNTLVRAGTGCCRGKAAAGARWLQGGRQEQLGNVSLVSCSRHCSWQRGDPLELQWQQVGAGAAATSVQQPRGDDSSCSSHE